ncbi:MAG: glycosyltransferase [Planctomycetota bacterium]|jgi:glycosyltransferase involved in cell wall biosynthesis|nr:glycosyltransferase [Planctomycetota bacterium]
MRISLLISTYERPDALAAVLRSLGRQTLKPFDIVIGDDGSGPATAAAIQAARARGLPLRHEWEPHQGYRLARMRNLCAAAAGGDYLIIVDGDVLLHPDFVADHAAAAEKGFFVQGSRALLNEADTRLAIAADAFWPSFFRPGIGNRKNLLRWPGLARRLPSRRQGLKGIRTCNFAVWREDYAGVNGFNEDFIGWGREDSEFATRLLNRGVRRRNLHCAGLVCHLHHPARSRNGLAKNDRQLERAVAGKAVFCERGLNLHQGGKPEGAAAPAGGKG